MRKAAIVVTLQSHVREAELCGGTPHCPRFIANILSTIRTPICIVMVVLLLHKKKEEKEKKKK